ncbi:MAG TPA: hypothetical protein VNI54_11115 [Thermoanaerobaculia bacterium]|nr:hypothetical protein [Thermoanaerobaculia bacterium]
MEGAVEEIAVRVIVGATARDLLLHHVHGLPIRRLTRDLDVAVMIGAWKHFELLKERIIANGGQQVPDIVHRVQLHGWSVDILPFGNVEVDGTVRTSSSDSASTLNTPPPHSSAGTRPDSPNLVPLRE